MPLLSYILACVCPPDEVAAEKLKAGDAVMVNGKAMQLREVGWIMELVDVTKITFYPDYAVNAFHKPAGCILSKGHKKCHRTPGHRGGQNRRGRPGKPVAADAVDVNSIPDTEGYITD